MTKKKDTTTDLTTTQPGDVVAYDYSDYLDDVEDLARNDLVVPYYSIVQSKSETAIGKGGEPGHFFSDLDAENFSELHVLPLRITTQRKKYPPYRPGEAQRPVCESRDGIVPAPWVEHPVSDVCSRVERGRRVIVCPDADWSQCAKGDKPSCLLQYVMLAINLDTQSPFIIRFSGLNVKPTKALRTYANMRRAPLYAFACTLYLRDVAGTWVYAARDFEAVDPAIGHDALASFGDAADVAEAKMDDVSDDADAGDAGEDLQF